MKKLILNDKQVESVYCMLKVGETAHMRECDMRFTKAIVTCDSNGTIRVIGTGVVDDERYTDLAEFAAAYGIKG